MSDTIKLLSQLINDLSPEKRELLAGMLNDSAEPLAIIGLGCRFPGKANSPEAFWQMLQAGVDAISKVPSDRWNTNASTDEDDDVAVMMAKASAQWGGFLEQVDTFDASFFGIAPREVIYMDPQQRLLLEVAWEALENAGQGVDRLAGSQTGVFVGVCTSDYLNFHIRSADHIHLDPYTTSGTAHSIVANRLSYLLDFRGPSVAVDTACSSSLVAVHLACQSLRNKECRIALAGGVNLMLSPEPGLAFSRLGMLASDGRCKTFDTQADGYVRGEGCGVIVLKRLSDAKADGDPILALIRGSAINQDGHSNGLTAPSAMAQEAVIRQALRNAGVSPEQVGYIEAHGTGTSLGDPIEIEALTKVLGQPRSTGTTALGSVKTNIGHLEAAAGIAGLIKTVLALHHEAIPPHLHFRTLNPNISLTNTPFAIPTKVQPWPTNGERRFAGVSAFGFGGTNAHIVLEEAPQFARADQKSDIPPYLLPLSARSPEALQALAQAYRQLLLSDSTLPISDLCYTASMRRSHHKYRLALLAHSRAGLIHILETWQQNQTSHALSAQTCEVALQVLQAAGYTNFLEIGSHPTPPMTLSAIQEGLELHQQGLLVTSPDAGRSEQAAILEALGTLYTHGYAIDWSVFYPNGGPCLTLPPYPWQRKRFWVESKPVTQGSLPTKSPPLHTSLENQADILPPVTDWIYDLKWQPREQKPSQPRKYDTRGVQGNWLILADSRGVGKSLARQLEALGERCVLVFPGQTFAQIAPSSYQLNPASPADFQRLLTELYDEQRPYCTVVHLWSLEEAAPAEMLIPSLDDNSFSCCQSVESVLHLLHALPQVKWSPSPRLWLVTCGAQPVVASTPLSVTQAPVWGMGRTISLEYSHLWGGMVDLDPQASPEVSASQLMEVLSEARVDGTTERAINGEDQLAFRGDLCYVLRLLPWRNSDYVNLQPMHIRADSSYLITGGLGAIGLKVAFWLAEHGARHLVLLGRTGLPDPANLEQMAPSSETRKRVEAVRALEALGVEVRIAEADVSDLDQVARVFENIARSNFPLRGIMHSAGISVSQTIGNLDSATLQTVLQPKVKGSWVLHQLSQRMELDFFVLFSSASAVWGSPQLAAYTAANLFPDALAHTRRAQGLPALSINWGLWAESGMVSQKIEQVISKAGVLPMHSQPALAALEYLLGTDAVQATVAHVDWQIFIPMYETGRKQPLLTYMGAGLSQQSEPPVTEQSELVNRLERATYQERQVLLEQHIQAEVNQVMGFAQAYSLDPEQSLFELGMDSLMALKLENRLERSLGRAFPTTVSFDYPTVAALAQCLNDWCFN